MTTLGTIRWTSGSPAINLTLSYEKKRSGADMQYRASVSVSAVSGGSYFGYPIYLKLSMDNALKETVTLKAASPSQWTSAIVYTSPWYTIANKTTGTVPISFNVYSGYGCTRSDTYTYSMPVDAAGSAISASNGTLGTPLTIKVTRYNSSFVDTIKYTCGTASGTIITDSKSDTVTWNGDNGNTVALSSQNTTGLSVPVILTITTYSGSTVVGTNSVRVVMSIPPAVKPSVSLKVSDPTGYATTYGEYIQGYSKMKIEASTGMAYSSPITSYSIVADGVTYTSTPVTTDVIRGSGSLAVTARVTDARTRVSDPASVPITVLQYSKPVVSLAAYRCDSAGNSNSEGAYMKINLRATLTSLNGKNTASYVITYKSETGAAVTVSGDGTTYTSDPIQCDVSKTYAIEAVVSDDLSSSKQTVTIPVAFTLMDYYSTGKGIAFGKVATRDGLDCAMPTYFGNHRVQEVGTPEAAGDAVPLGFLVDYIVAQGESGIWKYRKWSSGRAECWGKRKEKVDITTAWGTALYYGSMSFIAFPFVFSEAPACVVTAEYGDDNVSAFVASSGYATTEYTPTVLLCRPTSASAKSCTVVYHAYGRWK